MYIPTTVQVVKDVGLGHNCAPSLPATKTALLCFVLIERIVGLLMKVMLYLYQSPLYVLPENFLSTLLPLT